MNLVDAARYFCIAAHSATGQVRKYTGEPYFEHPMQVAQILKVHVPTVTDEMLAAAFLHDVVEDTEVPLSLIVTMFGPIVGAYVEQLTDVSRPEDGNRARRKAIDREHTAKASPEAKTIKLADLISNTRSIVARDPDFAVTYLAEKRQLLQVLTEGDPVLYRIATDLAAS
jgi:(p)ppGpp synthase/HD superfamily hydrolase